MQKQRCNGIERKLITHRPQPIDHARGDKAYMRALLLRFALANVRNVYLYDWSMEQLHRFDYRYGHEHTAWIDDHAGRMFACLVNPIDHLRLVVGLPKGAFQPEIVGAGCAASLNFSERLAIVEIGRTDSGEVEIRSNEDVDGFDHTHVWPLRPVDAGATAAA
jgi:hypothetical protein